MSELDALQQDLAEARALIRDVYHAGAFPFEGRMDLRLRDWLSAHPAYFPPQCHSLDPGVYGRAGWADQDDEGRLA